MEGVQEGRDICILWLIHVDVWQKWNQYSKTIINQSKLNNYFFKKEIVLFYLASLSIFDKRLRLLWLPFLNQTPSFTPHLLCPLKPGASQHMLKGWHFLWNSPSLDCSMKRGACFLPSHWGTLSWFSYPVLRDSCAISLKRCQTPALLKAHRFPRISGLRIIVLNHMLATLALSLFCWLSVWLLPLHPS